MTSTTTLIPLHPAGMDAVNVHIDWIHIYAPCEHLPTGQLFYLDDDGLHQLVPTGATRNTKTFRDGCKKAYVHSKEINGRTGMASMIEVQCCPPKVLQRHNLFGHGDLQAYVYAILDYVTRRHGISVRAEDRASWLKGHVTLTCIHLTANFGRPFGMSIPIIQAIDENRNSHKNRVLESWITLNGATERRSTFDVLTVYDKRLEMLSHTAWRKPGPLQSMLLAEADRGIRVELKLFSDSLKYYGLGYVNRWIGVDIAALYFDYLNKYNLCYAIQRLLTEDELACLTRAERKAYTLWLKGVDLKEVYCRTTAWKLAKDILDKTDINVKGHRRPEKLPALDLRDIFTPENVLPVPSWAYGTECFVAPRGYGIGRVPVYRSAIDAEEIKAESYTGS
jgi:hypothetical protein